MQSVHTAPAQEKVLDAVRQADEPIQPKEIEERTGLTRDSVNAALRKLKDQGLLAQPGYGLYDLPENVPATREEDGNSSYGKVNTSALDDILRNSKKAKDVIDGLVVWRYHPEAQRGDAGAGAIQDVASEEVKTVVRHKDEVRRQTGHSATSLEVVFVAGDSMKDSIRPNTEALFLPMEDGFGVDGIYVISRDGAEVVKRVQQLGGGAIMLKSDNDDYEDELYIPLEEADTPNTYRSERTGLTCSIRCVGRVVVYTVST